MRTLIDEYGIVIIVIAVAVLLFAIFMVLKPIISNAIKTQVNNFTNNANNAGSGA